MLPMLPHDKANHAIYGAAIGLICAAVAPHVMVDPWMLALIVPVVVGAAKEIADKIEGSGAPSIADAIATAAGGAVVSVATLL